MALIARVDPVAAPAAEPPLYRPYALLALGATLAVGTPLGLWMLAWRYLGAPAVAMPWIVLHAHVQVVGFFGTLIAGVAQHLLPRFAGRAVLRHPWGPWLAAGLGTALLVRVAGTAAGAPAPLAGAALVQAAGFAAFAVWVWRILGTASLVRLHLTLASAWIAAACAAEAGFRVRALVAGAGWPGTDELRAVHAVALLAGVLGWVLGVLLRAGPMFVPGWAVPVRVARAVPAVLAVAAVLGAAGELAPRGGPTAAALARLGDALALAAVAAVAVGGGALRRAPRALPLLSRSAEESRIVRLALVAAGGGLLGMLAASGIALAGGQAHAVADAARHLLAIGFLTSIAVAMAFRLVVVLEGVPLAWPALRDVALAALAGAIVLRTAGVLVAHAWPGLAPLVALSGTLAWLALAALAVTVGRAILDRRRLDRARERRSPAGGERPGPPGSRRPDGPCFVKLPGRHGAGAS
jgi:hypothetical protein